MACARACHQGVPLAVIDIRDVYTLLGRLVDVMTDIGSRAAFEQNAAPEIALNRAAQNIFSPSASQREQQEAAAAQGLGGGVGALGGSVENAIVAAINNNVVAAINNMNTGMVTLGNNIKDRFIYVETRVDVVEDKVEVMDGRVDAMDEKVEDVRKEATEKVGAFEVRLNAVAASAHASGQTSFERLAEHTQKLAELANLKRKVEEIEAVKRAPGEIRNTHNMVWGRKIHSMHVNGKFRKPPKSGILLVHEFQGKFNVRDFLKEQNAKRLKYQTGEKIKSTQEFDVKFTTSAGAKNFRDAQLAKLHLYVEQNDNNEYRVAVMPGYDEAVGGGAASAGSS